MQPITVRQVGKEYEIIDGHRRAEAFRRFGKEEIPAIISNVSDREAQVMAVVTNLQREDLSNIEKAIAFQKILASGLFKDKREFSKSIGKDETYVGNLVNTVNMNQRIIDDLIQNVMNKRNHQS